MSPIRRNRSEPDDTTPAAASATPSTTATESSSSTGAAPTVQRELLGRVLVARGDVTSTQVNAASRAQKKGDSRRIGEILVDQGAIDEAALAGGLAAQAGLPVINLEETVPSERAIARLDEAVARELRVVPVRLSRSGLIIAVEQVPSSETMRRLAELADTKIGIGISTASQITHALAAAYNPADAADGAADGSAPTAASASATPAAAGSSGHQPRRRLGELLLERDLLSPEDLQKALHLQTTSGQRLGEELIELGILDERDLASALAEQLGLPLVDLRQSTPEPAALEIIPETLARGLTAVPMQIHPHGLDVVVADPDQPGMVDELTRAAGRPIRLMLAPTSAVKRAIDQSYRALAGVERHIRDFALTSPVATEAQAVLQRAVDQDAPVVQVVNLIITQALRDRASDIHIEPQGERVRIRMRTDGALHEVLTLPDGDGPGDRQPHQGHGRHEHRGTAARARRPDPDGRRRARARHPRRHLARDLRREGGAPAPRQEPIALQARRPRHGRGDRQAVLRPRAVAVRHDDLRGPDRERQDHDRSTRRWPRSTRPNAT